MFKNKINITFDNIIFSLQKAGGISVYWYEILNRLEPSRDLPIYEASNENIFCHRLNIKTKPESSIPMNVVRYLPFLQKIPKNSIFHSSYYRYTRQKSVANITTVYDFTYEYYVFGIKRLIHSFQKRKAISNSAGIICISESTKRDLLKFYPKTDPEKVRVIHISASDEFFPLCADTIVPEKFSKLSEKRYVLFVGDRSSYKNFDKTVDVIESFPDLELVVVGGRPFSEIEKILLNKVKERVHAVGSISSDELNWLYNHAFCLFYPSSYEGFGIPILEAMKAGCPVVSTRLSSIPEVSGDAAVLVEEPSVVLLSESVNALFDFGVRKELIDKGFNQASKFSWDKCFEETMAFYEEVWEREFGDNY